MKVKIKNTIRKVMINGHPYYPGDVVDVATDKFVESFMIDVSPIVVPIVAPEVYVCSDAIMVRNAVETEIEETMIKSTPLLDKDRVASVFEETVEIIEKPKRSRRKKV